MPTSDEELERQRWLLLRWAPRHDSGVLYGGDASEVWAQTVVTAVPLLVSTGDFAPADMQYRMHRAHLWDPRTGLYGDAYDIDGGVWVRGPSPLGNVLIADAMVRALRIGGDGTPEEMRDRWQRETRALIDACAALRLDGDAARVLASAVSMAREDARLD